MIKRIQYFCSAAVVAITMILYSTVAQAEENVCGPASQADEELINLRVESENLKLRIKQLEEVRCIPLERLREKKIMRLKEIAATVKIQRQSSSDFQGFVQWMSANLAGYNRYIQAGSYAAVIGRMLPIPYAGQASFFTKFVVQFTAELNATSVAINNYLNSSQKFIAMTDAIDPMKTTDDIPVTDAAIFADQKLLKDMNNAQLKLATLSDLSTGALSFLESLNHYISGTDEYWNRMKGVFKKDVDPKEKSFISENTGNLKAQADRFNGKLKSFEELGKKETVGVKALAVYDELAAEAASVR